MDQEISGANAKRWTVISRLLSIGVAIWRVSLSLPALAILIVFASQQKPLEKCIQTQSGIGAIIEVAFMALTTIILIWASCFLSPQKFARSCKRDPMTVRIRTEGLLWLVLATTGVGGACLALASTMDPCRWIGAGIALTGFLWVAGGLGAIFIHCALVKLRLIETNLIPNLAEGHGRDAPQPTRYSKSVSSGQTQDNPRESTDESIDTDGQ